MYRALSHSTDPAALTSQPLRQWSNLLGRLLHCNHAAIGPMAALMLVPISGSVALAVEVGGWYYVQRSAQNAADSAAIAAATNNNQTGVGSTYLAEARAAARPYGYVNGQGNVTVTSAPVTCPVGTAAGSTCYEAVVTTLFPLSFSRVLGYAGSQALGTGRGQLVKARAIATAAGGGTASQDICVLALSSATSPAPFQSNGGPKPDMAGCSIMSNGNMTCNGHNLGATYGISAGTDNGCGVTGISNASPITDPYAARASNIPSNSCSSYPQIPSKHNDPDLPASNLITGSKAWTGNQVFCGDTQLSGNVTLTGSNTTVIIQNGVLDLNGHTISTASGAAATIVFSGTNSSSYAHYPTGSGTMDIQAPTSGAWSGVAIYQNPALTTNVSFTYSGNSPTWNITGLVYLPKADVTFSGAVNKSANGASCFVLVSYTVLVNGTANIFASNTQCAAAGLMPPSSTIGTGVSTREKLVL